MQQRFANRCWWKMTSAWGAFFEGKRDISKSNRDGMDQTLKTMAFPYKMKGLEKMTQISTFGFFNFIRTCQNLIGRAQTKNCKLWLFHIKSRVGKNWSRIYTFGRSPSAILTIYNQIFFSRGPSALIFRDLSFLICFIWFCWRKSAFLQKKGGKKVTKMAKNTKIFIKLSSVGRFRLVPS